uniref:Radical SAM protein n=2 Tax=Geoglobus ahangari TaxID=113653 RepID=A0A7C3UDC1_9EURY
MIALSKLVGGKATVSKRLTYKSEEKIPNTLVEAKKNPIPVVVWNITSKCNLRCVHCYANVNSVSEFDAASSLIDDLSALKIPVLLMSGGEPLMHKNIYDIIEYAKSKGIQVSLSTNGTLIDEEVAGKLKELGVDYVGVSLDGIKETHDLFRGVRGAFEKAVEGLLNARDEGLLTGVRFTVTKYNLRDVKSILDFVIENEIPRFCLYHLVPSGRADFSMDITPNERRELMEWLFNKAIDLRDSKEKTEILTVNNPADGVFFYLKLKEIDEKLAEDAFEFLKYRGGDNSGFRLACIDFYGNVHPNQFWFDYTVGNVFKEKFSELWMNPRDELLIKLREKQKYLRGRCGKCKFKEICGGFRLRALRAGDVWGEDPSCYLKEV